MIKILDKFSRKYLVNLFHYAGIGFVWWSMSHWFFTWERSFYMIIIWLILYVSWDILWKKKWKKIQYWKVVFIWVIYSISIWMVAWGFNISLNPQREV